MDLLSGQTGTPVRLPVSENVGPKRRDGGHGKRGLHPQRAGAVAHCLARLTFTQSSSSRAAIESFGTVACWWSVVEKWICDCSMDSIPIRKASRKAKNLSQLLSEVLWASIRDHGQN